MNRNLSFILIAIFFLFATQTIVSVLVPITASDMAVGGTFIGLLVGLPSAIALLTEVPAAAFSDSIGRRLPMLIGAAIAVLASILFAFSAAPFPLTVSVIVYGAAMSVSAVPALAFVTEASRPENHAHVQGFNGAAQGLSALVGAVSVGLMLQLTSPRVAFGVVTLLALLVLFAVAKTNDQTGSPRPGFRLASVLRSYARVVTLVRTNRQVQLAGLVSLNYTFVFLVIGNAFLPLLLIKTLGLSAVFAGLVLGLRSIVATIVSSSFGFIVGHVGFRRAMLTTNAAAAVAVLLTATARAPVVFLILAVLQGVGCGFSAATANLLVVSATAETERALGFSTASFVSRIGTLFLPLLVGGILQLAGIAAAFLVAGFVSVSCVVALTLLSSRMVSIEPMGRIDVRRS